MSSFTFADWTYLPKQQYYVPPKELAQANIKPPAPQRTLEEIIADINRTEPYQMPIQKKQQINQKVNILRPSKSRMTAGATASRRLIPKIPGYCGPAEAAVLYRALEKEYEEVRNGWYDPIYPIRIIDDREFTKEDLHRERRRFFKEMTGRATRKFDPSGRVRCVFECCVGRWLIIGKISSSARWWVLEEELGWGYGGRVLWWEEEREEFHTQGGLGSGYFAGKGKGGGGRWSTILKWEKGSWGGQEVLYRSMKMKRGRMQIGIEPLLSTFHWRRKRTRRDGYCEGTSFSGIHLTQSSIHPPIHPASNSYRLAYLLPT